MTVAVYEQIEQNEPRFDGAKAWRHLAERLGGVGGASRRIADAPGAVRAVAPPSTRRGHSAPRRSADPPAPARVSMTAPRVESAPTVVYTVGHSSYPIEVFLGLLSRHGITVIADVRSQPYSRRHPQFSREPLEESLHRSGIAYLFVGRELGARANDPACYVGDQVQYDLLAKTESFQRALERVQAIARSQRLALLCAEREPLECHRTILVARHVVARGLEVRHILADGGIETHEAALERLIRQLRMADTDLFRSREEVEAEAYARQAALMAYRR